MSKTGRWAVRLPLSACVALNFSCSHGSPTEPMVSRVSLHIALTPGLISADESSESAVLVQADICSCTKAPVTVSVNGTMAGTVGCGETISLSIRPPSGNSFNIMVQSPEINPVATSLLFGGSSLAGASFRIPITLTCAQR